MKNDSLSTAISERAADNFFELKDVAYYCPVRDEIVEVTEGPYVHFFLWCDIFPMIIERGRFDMVFGKAWVRLGEV